MLTTLKTTQVFLEKQTDLAHSFDVATQCEEALKIGSLPAGLPVVQKKYALSNIDARALAHDCSVYVLGKLAGGVEQSLRDATDKDRRK